MRKLVILVALLATAACSPKPVFATDLALKKKATPAPEVYTAFTGAYLGVNLGGATNFGNTVAAFETVPLGELHQHPQSFVGGLQGGYGWRFGGPFYVGIDGMFDWTGLEGTASDTSGISATTKNSWLAAIGGRFGFVFFNNLLAYGSVGAGWGGGKLTINDANITLADSKKTLEGLTWAVGVEYAFTNDWTGGLEYRQFDFGHHSVSCDPIVCGPNIMFTQKDRVDAVLGRVSYHLPF